MSETKKKIKIAVDPGHGNANRTPGVYDPGAVSGGIEEADIALAWALTMKHIGPEYGFDIWLTRDDDRDVTPVSTRDNRADAADCDFFISLHCNAADGHAQGTEAYYRDAKDLAFGEIALGACCAAMNSRNRGMKSEDQSQHARIAIFNVSCPATLLEIEFIDNPAARQKLTNRARRIDFARRFFSALRDKAGALA